MPFDETIDIIIKESFKKNNVFLEMPLSINSELIITMTTVLFSNVPFDETIDIIIKELFKGKQTF